jgi:hypothetical protein
MKTVSVHDIDTNQVMDIVRELRQQGMVQGQDFDFAYHQSKWDEMIGEIPRETKFTFYNDQLATWFQLKYA